ncbi:cytochrome c oxidase subunit 2A [Xylanibacillus composti]|nr:cytochrome c oxidase subunit 2A [Xylanibacillus composti]
MTKGSTEARKPVEQQTAKEPTLKGTFVSVMILGGFLAVSWLLVFFLFLARQ